MLHSQSKVQIGVWLEPEVVANCDTYAEYFSQSRSSFINEALKLYLRHVEKRQLLVENEKSELNSHKHTHRRSAGSVSFPALFTIFIHPNLVLRKILAGF
jgi:metal-responsive CopG/Arc/MetJ family transcriptional regulator